jgi:hypothetical protein
MQSIAASTKRQAFHGAFRIEPGSPKLMSAKVDSNSQCTSRSGRLKRQNGCQTISHNTTPFSCPRAIVDARGVAVLLPMKPPHSLRPFGRVGPPPGLETTSAAARWHSLIPANDVERVLTDVDADDGDSGIEM